jgi:hypothetical protein
MGNRHQCIEIGFGIQTIIRCVYDIRNNDRFKFQTGFVQYDNNEIPVWRPFDPTDMSWEASWRKGKWENIYMLRMNHTKATTYVEYESAELEVEGCTIPLPKVSIELMHAFKMYLKKAKG